MTTLLEQERPPAPAARDVADAPSRVPPMIETNGFAAPRAPSQLDRTGVEPAVLHDLALKLAHTVPRLTTEWAAGQLCLPLQLVCEIYDSLRHDRLVEVLGQQGHFNYSYAATERGREYAARLFEICGYVGPAPVSLASYTAMLEWQSARRPHITLDQIRAAISALVLPENAIQVAALAASSGRSLFLFGPAGNGKTSMGQMLHNVMEGDLWIPHCMSVGSSIIRVYDRQFHKPFEGDGSPVAGNIDRRWLRVRRPLIVAGGEMTIDELDLAYSPSLRFYEAPPHVKANGGTFLIDDFGRQRVDPHELLNRWIIPLEHRVDHLTLHTGQKIQIPFRLMLVVATNLKVTDVADPAFLRRMGYRLHLERPDEQSYARIFQRYAAGLGVKAPDTLIAALLDRYRAEKRELRASEPGALIERARDICVLHARRFELAPDVMDLAWEGFFGNTT